MKEEWSQIFQPVESLSSAIWTQSDHRPTKDLQNTFESLLTVRVRNENTKSESERELRFTVVFQVSNISYCSY